MADLTASEMVSLEIVMPTELIARMDDRIRGSGISREDFVNAVLTLYVVDIMYERRLQQELQQAAQISSDPRPIQVAAEGNEPPRDPAVPAVKAIEPGHGSSWMTYDGAPIVPGMAVWYFPRVGSQGIKARVLAICRKLVKIQCEDAGHREVCNVATKNLEARRD